MKYLIPIIIIVVTLVGINISESLGGNEPMTYSEYQEYIEMVNYELKKHNGKIKVNKGETPLQAINRAILKRKPSKSERGKGQMTYEERREYLINKVK